MRCTLLIVSVRWTLEPSTKRPYDLMLMLSHIDIKPVAPVAYQVILEPGIGQFREFESPRVHTRINSWGLFLAHKFTCGKRESVS